jgi:hypothetical protein
MGVAVHADSPSYFLGWGIVLLVVIGLAASRWDTRVVAIGVFGIAAIILSLGTVIRLGSISLVAHALTPFYWLSRLPFLGMIDCPVRFTIAAQLAIAVSAAIAARNLFSGRFGSTRVFIGLMLALFSVEYGTFNIETSDIYVPAVYKAISGYNDNRTVLEIPSGILESKGGFGNDWENPREHNRQMFWQTVHQKPRIGGYISRVSNSVYRFYKNEPVISDLFAMASPKGQWSNKDYSKLELSTFVNRFNLGYIVLGPHPRQGEYAIIVEQLFRDYVASRVESEGYFMYAIMPTRQQPAVTVKEESAHG